MPTVATYRVHTIESAPEESRPALERLQQNFGLVPNLAATMAESPILVNGFVQALVNFLGSSFTGAQRQVLLLTNATTNRSAWAVAFHSTAALREGVEPRDVEAIRQGRSPDDRSFAALSRFTKSLIDKRGHVDEADVRAFVEAGFTHRQAFDVIAGLAVSVMANYAGNIANPPVEEPFKAQTWSV